MLLWLNLAGPEQPVVTPRTEWMRHCQCSCSGHFNPYLKEAEGQAVPCHRIFPKTGAQTLYFLLTLSLRLVILGNTWGLSPSVGTSSLLATGPGGCNDFWSAPKLLSFGQNFVSFFKGTNKELWSNWRVFLQGTACSCCFDYFQLYCLVCPFHRGWYCRSERQRLGKTKAGRAQLDTMAGENGPGERRRRNGLQECPGEVQIRY